MSASSKLLLLALAAVLGLAALELGMLRPAPEELTQLALRQLEPSDGAAQDLRTADAAKNWWLLAGPAGLLLFGALLFWDDVERWWSPPLAASRSRPRASAKPQAATTEDQS